MGGGWVIPFQHQCTNDEGLRDIIYWCCSGTPNSGSSDFKEQDLLLVHNSGITMVLQKLWYTEEIQTAGGSYVGHMHMLVAVVEMFSANQIFKTYLVKEWWL